MLLEESSTCLRITLEEEQKPGQRGKNKFGEEVEEGNCGRMEMMLWGGSGREVSGASQGLEM